MLGACGQDAKRDNPLDPELMPLVPGWQAFTARDGLAHNNVFSMYQSSDEAMWFGTSAGVSRYDGLDWQAFTTNDGLVSNIVFRCMSPRMGRCGSEQSVTSHGVV